MHEIQTMRMQKRALVIAEDPSFRNSLARVFEESRYAVLRASDNEQAVGLFHRVAPDIVILDLHEAGSCTSEVIPALKEINPLVPIIVLTKRLEEVSSRFAADAFIRKLVDIDKLLATAEKFVSESVIPTAKDADESAFY